MPTESSNQDVAVSEASGNAKHAPDVPIEQVPPVVRGEGVGSEIVALVKYMTRTEVHTYAFSVAANVILSLFPFIVMMLTISREVFHSTTMKDVVVEMMGSFLPSNQDFIMRNMVLLAQPHKGAQIYSVIMLLISSTGIFLPLEVALNGVWGVRENRSYLHNQVVSFGLAIAVGVLAMTSVALTAGQRSVLAWIFFGHTDNFVYNLVNGGMLRVLAGIVSILIFFLIYWILPNRKIPALAVLPTAIVIGLLWEGAKYLYVLALPRLDLDSVYGPFRVSVGLMLWAFLSGLLLLAGAHFSATRHALAVARREKIEYEQQEAGEFANTGIEANAKALESGQTQVKAKWWRRRPPTGVAGAVFWLALWFGLLWLLRQAPSFDGALLGWMQVLVGLALIGLAVPLGWRLVQQRLLWSLRSKLILTYLLIGLAPVVLFVTLAVVSAYIAGQFSIHLADSRMMRELDELGANNALRASGAARMMRARAEGFGGPPRGPRGFGPRPNGARRPAGSAQAAAPATTQNAATAPSEAIGQTASTETTQAGVSSAETLPDPLRARLHPHTSIYLNGAPLPGLAGLPPPLAAQAPETKTPLGLPPWVADLRGNQFRGRVVDGDDLYLVAVDQRHVEGGTLTVVTSLPVDSDLMEVVAEGLGRVKLSALLTGNPHVTPANAAGARPRRNSGHDASVYGGAEPNAVNFCDIGVPFASTLDITDWETGDPDNVPIVVHSRPSVLYKQLFGGSLSGFVTSYIRIGLLALCIVFALIEALALWMAARLSRTITESVHGLYAATQRVDRGDFLHRIPLALAGQKDQLGELARSFNRMTGSLERLMVEQHEKERLQSELTIAQEVQANLFPHHVRDLPKLELHGICRPARSVSGDYYDFLIFHHPDNPDGTPGGESGVGIALGDISGKGISAALLMATLHSAVRAYRLSGEDMVYSESSLEGLMASREPLPGDGGKLFESPGKILSMLNRHLFRSTQPSKYATLFLAHYDAATSRLTYSNAGHLPPLVLSRDGKVRRLDVGGTVVGLMDGMRYDEDCFQMRSGDILVAYSDGITEPENDFGEFGEARLMEVVARYRDQPLEVISAQVMLALDTWIGAEEQPDDITLVLARQM